MAALMNDDARASGDSDSESGLTPEDLELGKKAVKFVSLLSVIALVVALGISFYVFMSVPWDTKLPYNGRFGRNGLPMPFVMLLCLILLVMFWRVGKKPTAHHMGKAARGAYYVIAPAMILGVVWGQWILARSILVEGGALPG